MTYIGDTEWWTRREVANHLGVQPSSLNGMIRDLGMPPPEARVERSPLWRPETIRAWHQQRSGQA